MDAITLPADYCVFGHFEQGSPFPVHSGECWYSIDCGLHWVLFIHLISHLTMNCSGSKFLPLLHSDTKIPKFLQTVLRNNFKNSFLIEKCSSMKPNLSAISCHFTYGLLKRFCRLFYVIRGHHLFSSVTYGSSYEFFSWCYMSIVFETFCGIYFNLASQDLDQVSGLSR